MNNSIREIFNPTPDEEIKLYKRLIDLHNEQIGQCSTCIHYIPTKMPGFVTDYGNCRAKSVIFSKKVTTHKEIGCFYYMEETNYVNNLKKLIVELKGGKNDNNR